MRFRFRSLPVKASNLDLSYLVKVKYKTSYLLLLGLLTNVNLDKRIYDLEKKK